LLRCAKMHVGLSLYFLIENSGHFRGYFYTMDIKFHGHACFTISDKILTIVTDPYTESTGLSLPSLTANVVTVSYESPNHNNFKAIQGDPRVFHWPGEYEVAGVHFRGIHSFHNSKDDEEQKENIIFCYIFKDLHLCHLGAQGTKLTSEQLEKVGDVDVLFVPVGKKGALDGKKTKEVIEQIEPRVIIPMMYHTEGSILELDPLNQFLSAMGSNNVESLDQFTFKKSELPENTSKIIVLNPV